MLDALHPLDWAIIALYLASLIGYSAWLSRGHSSRADYYVGGRRLNPWAIAVSTMATQCSTNSILGAPAFVAFAAGGGLLWLQYELALPLAMIVVMVFLLPIFRRLRLISVYEYLEHRFGLPTRLVLSGLFQFVRAFATAVTVYSIAIVVELITGLPFFWSVVLLGVITIIYDVLGGVRAVIFSDLLQMAILVTVLLLLFVLLTAEAGGLGALLDALPPDRQQTLDFRHHGLGDGHTFAFWPMLLGGLFLYVSYYGCDQSQVQRELCARTPADGNKSLFLNGLLRFPVVLLYCFVGVGIAVHALETPGFLAALPEENGEPNYNLAVPLYMLQALPPGLVGLALAALFAAAMSSLDSVINSLSASTMEDFVRRFHRHRGRWSDATELWLSRLITIAWGVVSLSLAFQVGDVAPTVLEAINKIGSLINGPVLAVFALGLLTRTASGNGALAGLLAGFGFNVYCWLALPAVSWLWWNCFGFVATFAVGYGVSLARPTRRDTAAFVWTRSAYRAIGFAHSEGRRYRILVIAFVLMLLLLLWLQQV